METIHDIYTDATLAKARTLLTNEYAVQQDAEDESVYWAKGSAGSKYRVQVIRPVSADDESTMSMNADLEASGVRYGDYVDGKRVIPGDDAIPFVSCTCPNGLNRGGRPSCYHTAAVLLMLEEGTEPHIMESADPLDEAFIRDDEIARLKAEGYTDAEIEFLRS